MNAFRLILLLCAASFGCNYMVMPTDFSSVSAGTRANLKANFSETENKFNPCADSVHEVRSRFSGYTSSFKISSLENLRLQLDADASTTAKFILETSNGDTLFRVSEDSAAKFFGNLTIAGTSTHTGAATFASTLGVTGTFTASGTANLNSTLNAAGSVNLTGGNLNINRSNSGASVQALIWNTSNTASSDAILKLLAGGASGGDAFTDYGVNGGIHWSTGLDNSDGDAYVISEGIAPGSSNRFKIASGGSVSISGDLTVTSYIAADTIYSTRFHDEGPFTLTATGLTTSPTGTAYYERFGKTVTVIVPIISGTSNSNQFTLTGLPAAIRPSGSNIIYVPFTGMMNNGATVGTESGLSVEISNSSSLVFLINNTSTGWTSSGAKGMLRKASFTYLLQ
jgi:hypothetical protein